MIGRAGVRAAAASVAVIALLAGGVARGAQETVQISVPAFLSFLVADVGSGSAAAQNPTSVSFSAAALESGRALRISVKAEGNLNPPSGPAIAASHVSWVTSNAVQGVGTNGTLSATAYTQLFESFPDVASGSIDVTWTLAAPGTPLRAGVHDVTLRWRLESITP